MQPSYPSLEKKNCNENTNRKVYSIVMKILIKMCIRLKENTDKNVYSTE